MGYPQPLVTRPQTQIESPSSEISDFLAPMLTSNRSSRAGHHPNFSIAPAEQATGQPRRWRGKPWIWTLIFGYHEDRSPPHEATREAAMAAFAKSWRCK
jgi:hypothetical protein